MKAVVFENCFELTGHRIPYAGLVASALQEAGHEVTVCLPKLLEAQAASLKEYFDSRIQLKYFEATQRQSALQKILQMRSNLLEIITTYSPEYLAIPTADGVATSFAGYQLAPGSFAFSKTRIDICLMRAPLSNFMKWNAIKLGPWQRILLIDPLAWQSLEPKSNPRFVLCPDPVPKKKSDDQLIARRRLKLPEQRPIVAAVGPQTKRKGADRLIRAFFGVPNRNHALLAIIGKLAPEIKAMVTSLTQEQKDSLFLMDQFVSDDDFQAAIIASDLVAVPYRDVDRPSGIVSRCICWQRPIIATNQGWLRWAVENFDAGFSTCTDDPGKFGYAIQTALEGINEFLFSEKSIEFSQFNSEQNYQQIWQIGPQYKCS